MSRQVLLSPDGNRVAIRSDQADSQAWNAWGVFDARHGGHWSAQSELDGWTVLAVTDEVLPSSQPDPVVEMEDPSFPTSEEQ